MSRLRILVRLIGTCSNGCSITSESRMEHDCVLPEKSPFIIRLGN
jgi:hypothetical protein